ncbi:alanine racemase [Bordetella sp. N]|uniref:alanine racemase n=1 Tax=Bordetella sp. N TaxID=1746199 RepID=UPI00070FCA4A|nr:alanine racemase [Bordetella sp. N]ALM81993.1 alanine racemase [Bordetella sp. N]
MPRPITATISVDALTHNLEVVRKHVHQAAASAAKTQGRPLAPPSIWAVIKANAYGHGIEQAVRGFWQAQGLALLDLNEAVRCREAGWGGPIMLLEGFFEPADLEVLDRYHLTTAVHHPDQLAILAGNRGSRRLDIFMKLNTGMNRLGFAPDAYRAAYQQALRLRDDGVLNSVGKMTHFANADGPQGVADQMEVFDRITDGLPGPVSVSNSAATLRYPDISLARDDHAAWVRPGCCLYGISPFHDANAASFGLRPAMTLASRLISVQEVKAGAAVGYGSAFIADAPMRVGVVACGYADGYPRHAGTGTPVTVAGVRTRLLGRVSMDMLAVDLTPIPAAGVGAPVVLWGEGGPTVDEVAQAAETIGYELVCALAPRVPVQGRDI